MLQRQGQAILAKYGFTRAVTDDGAGPRRAAAAGGSARSGSRVPVLVLAIVAIAFFALPFIGLLWQAPWGDAWSILTLRQRSHGAAAVDRVLAVGDRRSPSLFGVPLAWLLARVEFPGRGVVRALCTLSMVLPPVVGGVALFYALGRRGLVGQYLDRWFGFRLPFTTAGVIVAQTFVPMPFLVITVEAAFRQLDRRFEDAARTLGALALVRVPAGHAARHPPGARRRRGARPGRGRSASSARRSRSPATSPGRTQTMPLAIYLAIEIEPRRGASCSAWC